MAKFLPVLKIGYLLYLLLHYKIIHYHFRLGFLIKFVLFQSFSKYNILWVTNTVLVNCVTGQKYVTLSCKTKWLYMGKK